MISAALSPDQGDPLAPLLFACGAAPRPQALEAALHALAGERGVDANRVRVPAYRGDVVVVAPPELAADVLPIV